MSDYRRYFIPGGTYFFTVVTHQRRPILTTESGRTSLREALARVRRERPFGLVAIVLLPDHLHTIWRLPHEDADYSMRWAQVKEQFTRSFLAAGGREGQRTVSRVLHRERAVWQHRFWEHTVRDEDDLERCVNYIHWNPVKHGLVSRVYDYPWSTFRKFVDAGDYEPGWGSGADPGDIPGAEWE